MTPEQARPFVKEFMRVFVAGDRPRVTLTYATELMLRPLDVLLRVPEMTPAEFRDLVQTVCDEVHVEIMGLDRPGDAA